MIESIKKSSKILTPEKAASFLPIIISSFIALLIVVFFVVPESIKSNKVNLELNEFIRKKNELENLKLKYKKNNQNFDKLKNEKFRIIELISGTSNLETLLANVGIIGKRNNIEFLSIIPKSQIISSDVVPINKNTNLNKNESIVIDPLLVEGTKKYLIDFSFKTDFINLISFLRELEFQENIILIQDIDVNVIDNKNNNINNNRNLDVILSMTFYGKI